MYCLARLKLNNELANLGTKGTTKLSALVTWEATRVVERISEPVDAKLRGIRKIPK